MNERVSIQYQFCFYGTRGDEVNKNIGKLCVEIVRYQGAFGSVATGRNKTNIKKGAFGLGLWAVGCVSAQAKEKKESSPFGLAVGFKAQ